MDSEIIRLATELFFLDKRERDNYNTPELGELVENGYYTRARDKLKEKPDYVKTIVFIRPLIPGLISGEVTATYRTYQLSGKYQVVCNRFPKRQCEACPHCVIEVTASFIFDPKSESLNGKSVGVSKVKRLKELLEKWYGPNRKFYRNNFRLLEVLEHDSSTHMGQGEKV